MTLRLSALVEEKMKEIINGWNLAIKHRKSSPRLSQSNHTNNANRYGVFLVCILKLSEARSTTGTVSQDEKLSFPLNQECVYEIDVTIDNCKRIFLLVMPLFCN
jgi:hypothetical protein